MRKAGRIVALTIERLVESVRPGMTTADLDHMAESIIRKEGAVPSFKGYRGFPGTDRESPALVREAMDELRRVYPVKHYLVGGHSQGGYLAYSLLMNSPEAVGPNAAKSLSVAKSWLNRRLASTPSTFMRVKPHPAFRPWRSP